VTDSPGSPHAHGAGRIGRAIASLGGATVVDLLIQFTIPMVLVRVMSGDDFGLYRTLWLIAGTLPGLLALGMPTSLYYFLPRSDPVRCRAFVVQAAGHMAVAAVIAAACTAAFVQLHDAGATLGWGAVAFVSMWVFASLLDYLYVAQQAVAIQVRVNVSFALLRVVLVVGAALAYQSWPAVLAAHLFVVGGKLLVCAIAVRRYAAAAVRPDRTTLADQYRYALPLGVSTSLYLLRGRLDQWLVASLFSVSQFGLYSVAAVFTPIQTLTRLTVNQVIQPELSRLQSQNDLVGMRELGRRSNLGVALLIWPAIAFISTWAEPILSLLFTPQFAGAAPIVRIYLLTMAVEALDIAMVLMAMRQGRFLMTVDAAVLPVALAVAVAGANTLGMTGAACGALAGALVAQIFLYRRFAKLSGVPVSGAQHWRAIARIIAAAALAAVVSLLARTTGPVPGGLLTTLLIAAVLFCGVYWIALRLLGLSDSVRLAFGRRLSHLVGFRA
jgi:O-antigen/teichoic acid export membrane protein